VHGHGEEEAREALEGEPSIRILDEEGEVVSSLP